MTTATLWGLTGAAPAPVTLSIKAFGAAADNLADDTAAVRAAAESGLSVVFADGEICRVTEAIASWADETSFLGSGSPRAGGIRMETSTANQNLISITSKSDITIKGLRLNGGRSGSHTAGYGVVLIGCTNCDVEDNRFSLIPSESILIRDASDNCTVVNNKFAIQGTGIAHIYLLTNVTNSVILDNEFEDSTGGCIWLSGNVLHTIIRNNKCDASTDELIGVRYNCRYGEISGNVARNTGDNGISVTGSGFKVFGNECYNNAHAGIGVYGSDNLVFGNDCYDNGESGGSQHPGILLNANFGGLAANNVVQANEVYRKDGVTTNQYYGIRVSNSSYTAWAAGAAVSTETFRVNENNLYFAVASGTTGGAAPTHLTGTVSDGAVSWTYVGTFTNTANRPSGNRIGKNKVRNHTGGDYAVFGSSVNEFDDEAKRILTYVAPQWVTATATEFGSVVVNTVVNVKRRYRALNAGNTGATAPTHTSGTASDGTITWYYVGEGDLHDIKTDTVLATLLTTRIKIQCVDSTSETLAPSIYAGTVNPEGANRGSNGSLYLRSNSTYGIAGYLKTGTTDTSTGWQVIQTRISDTTANRPAGLGVGQTGLEYFDTTLGIPVWWNGAAWVDATGAPA